MTIDSNRLLNLLEEVGRARALTDAETDMVEDIVMQDATPYRWTAALNLALERAAAMPGGIARFARRHSITPGMAYAQWHRIKKRKGCKGAKCRRRG